mmetsp:Transcript_61094/g.170902  ORF Transcript_61094/g.170902 Transcript_61094/m.170902 type:complete len:345 (-) Transcript_61094:139-1173(-)
MFGLFPLFVAHCRTALSLSSTYLQGFFSRIWSTKSKAPSSGKATGNRASGFSGAFDWFSTASSAAASCSMRTAKGKGFVGFPSGPPKSTANVTFLKVSVGYKALPLNVSGNSNGFETRLPSLKREMVKALGAPSTRFNKMPNTAPFAHTAGQAFSVRFFPWKKSPTLLKPKDSSLSERNNEDPAVEKPTLIVSCNPNVSTILNSNMYRPPLSPHVDREQVSKCWKPSEHMPYKMAPPWPTTASSVESKSLMATVAEIFLRLSAGASSSSSVGFTGSFFVGSSLATASFSSASSLAASGSAGLVRSSFGASGSVDFVGSAFGASGSSFGASGSVAFCCSSFCASF